MPKNPTLLAKKWGGGGIVKIRVKHIKSKKINKKNLLPLSLRGVRL